MNNYAYSDGWYSSGRHSDLEWGLDSPVVNMYSDRKSYENWLCGDRKKRKLAVTYFAKHSSMHGVQYICSRDPKTSNLKRVFYGMCFATCLLSMVGSLYTLIRESFNAQSMYISSTSKEVDSGPDEDPFFPKFPRIVVCRRPIYKMVDNSSEQELLEYSFLSLGYPFTPLTPEERMFMVGIQGFRLRYKGKKLPPFLQAYSDNLDRLRSLYDAKKEANFDLTKTIVNNGVTCEEIFINCFAFVLPKNCCEIFQPQLTSKGNCFSLLISDDIFKFFKQSKEMAYHFSIDLQASPQPRRSVAMGYEVHLMDPRDQEIFLPTEGHALLNGFMTVLKTRLHKTSRIALFTPWHGLTTHCPTLPTSLDLMGNGERYFRHACEKRYINKMMRDHCACRFITDRSDITMRQCDPVDVYQCFVPSALHDNLTGMNAICKHPCIEYTYRSEVNFVKIGSNNCRLVFKYDVNHYSLQEYKTTTVSGFLSQIGGALGLYLGASIITAVELLIFLGYWICYRFLPHKRVSVDDISVDILRRKTKQAAPSYSH